MLNGGRQRGRKRRRRRRQRDGLYLISKIHSVVVCLRVEKEISRLDLDHHWILQMPLPDPSQYPDPYPFRHKSPPPLSSAASSSTRSSAYTSSGSALPYVDYSVLVASPDDEPPPIGYTSDPVVRILPTDPVQSTSARGPLMTTSRWSESYSGGVRSRSSSLGNGLSNQAHEVSPPHLSQKPSYDISWQTVEEKDEVTMSEDETDDEPSLDAIDADSDEKHEERTSAAVVADEGRGLIVQGDNAPIVQLQVQPGSSAPNHPFFLLPAYSFL